MIRSIHLVLLSAAACLASTAVAVSPASAEFDVLTFKGGLFNQDHSTYTQAGGHPYSVSARFDFTAKGMFELEENIKDVAIDVPPGFIGNPLATPSRCTLEQLLSELPGAGRCPVGSQVGVADLLFPFGKDFNLEFPTFTGFPIFSMVPPPGYPAMFAFNVQATSALVLPTVRSDGDYGLTVHAQFPQLAFPPLNGIETTFWGNPSDSSHDTDRGYESAGEGSALSCGSPLFDEWGFPCSNPYPAELPKTAFLTAPVDCEEDILTTTLRAVSWQQPTNVKTKSFDHDENGNPAHVDGCEKVPFDPEVEARATTEGAETPSGLDFKLSFPDESLLNPDGIIQSPVKKLVSTFPEGMTLNPSVAEGMGVCTAADYKRETAESNPGEGCPNSSKLGTIAIETPLLEEAPEGALYLAQQDDPKTTAKGAENPFDSMLAVYFVAKIPVRGLIVKLAGKVEADKETGQLVSIFEDLPQLPVTSTHLQVREGKRAPLTTPPACGTYEVKNELIPWSDQDRVVTRTSEFEVTEGPGGSPCPSAGVPPFKPAFSAGSINNNAASHTDFNMRLIRNDGEQEMTRFDAVLPPGVLGKLAGVDKCPQAAIALAKTKRGRDERANPSCPANSLIGRSLAGAGVGPVLTYVPGMVYLGGPFNGRPLSVIAITPVVAGPFDIGTVAVQEALTLNPKTAEVEIDGAASDPIPHILEGIPAKLRDLRVYVDRPDFIINPTSCDPSATDATLFGSYLNVLSSADDVPVALSDRFQAASCQSLGFKPKLKLNLKGGTKRGGHPGLKATYRPRAKDANVKGLVVRLPSSAFLDQAHIRTICTRVQFAADNCPKAAQYGYIKAWTPLLEEPLQGPVWLRSSNHKLPDLVFDLHGLVDVEVATRIDSARGGIRATVSSAPDAPLSKVILTMQGGKKGLIQNSINLCAATHRANVQFSGHNGKEAKANPVMRPDGCAGKRKGKRTR